MNIEHTIFGTLLNITFITRSKFYVTNTVGFAVCAYFLRLISITLVSQLYTDHPVYYLIRIINDEIVKTKFLSCYLSRRYKLIVS